MTRAPSTTQRMTAAITAAVFLMAQLAPPTRAEAAALGSSTASAGSATPPTAAAIQSFQPDLFTGRATTAIPIAVPPGRKGMQPALALQYSSSGRNGWLGVGWNLDLGYIERSTKNGVPKYDATDSFTFMFQGVASELVRVPDGTYRAKDEGLFLRFENKGISGWEVRDKSGTRYLFGQTIASQVESSGQAFRWCLDQAIDTNGNTLSVTYTKDQSQLYPADIVYTGHTQGSPAPANKVSFRTSSARPDVEVNYRSGFPVTTAKRLDAIETYVLVSGAFALARRYELTYATSARTGRLTLSGVKQIGTDGVTSLPASTFNYSLTDTVSYQLATSPGSTSTPLWNIQAANMDTGNDNNMPCDFRLGVPWGSPVTQASGSVGSVSFSSGSDGSFWVSFPQDNFFHAWTWVYNTSSVSIPTFAYDVGCMWIEDSGGLRQVSGSGSVSLSPGWSIVHLTGYHQHEGRTMPYSFGLKNAVTIMSPSQFIQPQLAGDMDGNGITDLVTYNAANGNWSVALARQSSFTPTMLWLAGFGGLSSAPVLGDWNGDTLTDIGTFTNSTWAFATAQVTETTKRFQTGTVAGLSFGSGTPLTGDFNGDGVLDIGTTSGGSWQVALGTGSSFTPTSSFSLSSFGGSGYAPITGDFNGDGLTDIGLVADATGDVSVALSNGRAFIRQASNWALGVGAGWPHSSGDFNGDGLTDVAYYNRSAGQVVFAPSQGSGFGAQVTLPITFTKRSSDDQLQLGDFNGDGLADPAIFNVITGAAELAYSSGAIPDLLQLIENGLGGTTFLAYLVSTQCDNNGQSQAVPKLPFVLPVVQQVTTENGIGQAYTTTYLYQGGLYDAPTKEFRGFAHVEARDPDANVTITEFSQDAVLKGRPLSSEFRDASDTLWTRAEQTWSAVDPYPGVHFAKLDQSDSYAYDGDATSRHTRARFAYDTLHGNITTAYEDGDVDVLGDERQTTTTYTLNETAWILGKPALIQTRDQQGQVVAQRRFYYDGATNTAALPTAGNLTKEEEWLNNPLPGGQWLATQLAYDVYGNVTTVTDAATPPRTTTNTYDATGTYLTKITNTLGQSRELTYDPLLGQVLTSKDQNSVVTTTQYDALGRVTKVIGPNDSAVLPTISYEYTLSPTPPSTTVVRTRIQSGQAAVLTAYTFTDGLGRTIQTRTPAEDSAKQLVGGAVEYNRRGLAIKQWVAYLDDASASYVPHTLVSGLAAPVTYDYDQLGRAIRTTDPDGTITETSYNDGETTVSTGDHRTMRQVDAYGRLVRVDEVASLSETHTTTYAYDTLNNLVQVIDALGHETRIAYDSLGRKVSMDDPDMGHWDYAYDAVDNLTSQTDARGVATAFTYDALNRLTQKSYTIPAGAPVTNPGAVTYTYDGANDTSKPYAKGKLTKVADGSGTTTFEYDNLGRLVKETKTIGGTSYPIQRAYDLLGRLTSLTYPDADTATYTYNDQGGIETVSLKPAASAAQAIVSDIDYNAAGQLTKIAYGNGVVTDYSYNPQTLRLDQLRTVGGSGTLQDFRYTFDAIGNVTAIQDAVHTGSQTFDYDNLSRLTRATGAYGTFSYAYDAIGNMLEKEGTTMHYGENGAGPHAVSSTSAGWQMRYDANGSMLEKTIDPRAEVADLTPQLFTYDAENRLVKVETAPEQTVSLTFKPGWNFFALPVIPDDGAVVVLLPSFAQDFEQIAKFEPATNKFKHYVGNPKFNDFTKLEYGVGYQVFCKSSTDVTVSIKGKLPTRRLSKSLPVGWHLLPATGLVDQPTSQAFAGVDTVDVRGYASGSLTATTTAKTGQTYWVNVRSASTWSPALPKDVTTSFVYDGDGGKTKQITASGTTTLVGEVLEKDPTGKTTKYVFAGSMRIAAKESTGDLLFYHTDHLGSSDVVTNASGAVVEHTEHTPYGAISTHAGTKDLPHKFTGQRQDSGTGLILFPARAYDPALGRFLQADPFSQNASDPQLLNRYAYARGNPVRYTDPSGHFIFLAALAFIAASAAVAGAIGAVISLTAAAVTGRIHTFGDAFRSAGTGFAAGAAAGATGALGALILGPAITGTLLGSIALGAGSGAIGGGVGSALGGGSFAQGAAFGALTGGALAGVGHIVGPYIAQTPLGNAVGRLTNPITSRLGNLYNQALAPRNSGIEGMLTRAQSGIQSGLARLNNLLYEPLPQEIADTFAGGQYFAHRVSVGQRMYRAEGRSYGDFYGTVKPDSAASAMRMYNLPESNDMTQVTTYMATKSLIVYEGQVAGGTGTQYYVSAPNKYGLESLGPEPLPSGGGP